MNGINSFKMFFNIKEICLTTVVFSISLQLCDILAIVQVTFKHFSDAAAVQSAPTPLSPNVKTFQFSELPLGSSCVDWTWEMNILNVRWHPAADWL